MRETNENNENINYASLLLSLKNSSDERDAVRRTEGKEGNERGVPVVKVILYMFYLLNSRLNGVEVTALL
jgi:hypothetical protein